MNGRAEPNEQRRVAKPLRGAADRVARSHAQTRRTIALALVFIAASSIAWAIDDAPWFPLHLFLAGGVVLAISAVSLMLTVTWSAAPAPPDRAVRCQRSCVAAGAAGVVAGRHYDLGDVVVGVAGTIYVVGLAMLGALLAATLARGVERRFDPAVGAYLAAIGFGMIGVGIGVVMAVDAPSRDLRATHAAVNVLGLVGLVIAGTLPFFAATVGRSRMARHATLRRIVLTIGWQVVALSVAVAGLATATDPLAALGLVAYAVGLVATMALLPRPTRRQLRWAGPRLVALWLGVLWWIGAVVATARTVAVDGVLFDRRGLAVLVVAGYAQILWGSLAYLLPMLRGGGHERLSDGFAATRSWLGLGAVNLAGVAFAVSLSWLATGAVVVWVLDSAARAARVGFGRAQRREQPAKGSPP